MVKIYLMGGLGNVLFQFNYGRVLQKHGIDVYYCDILVQNKFISKIIGWSFHSTLITMLELDPNNKIGIKFIKSSPIDLVLLLASRKIKKPVLSRVFEPDEFLPNSRLNVVAGYFQGGINIDKELVILMRELLLKYIDIRSIDKEYKRLNSIAKSVPVVHFRGGDFIGERGDISRSDYYRKCLQDIDEFMVVTNDQHVALDYFSGLGKKNFHLVSSKNVIDDLSLIGSANTVISSPSTFCWWATEIGLAETIYEKDVMSCKSLSFVSLKERNYVS